MTTPTTVQVRFQFRADTAANWTSIDPVLLANELGRETDTGKIKIGDGTTAWSSLAYQGWSTLTYPLVNADIASDAAIDHSKLADITAGSVLLGNASNVPTATALSGDVTVNSSGVTAISAGAIVDADVSASAEIAVSKLANGTANQILTTDGTNVSWTDSPTIAGNVIISGNLTVNGTETIINVDTLQVEDKTIEMGVVATPTDLTADGGGIVLKGATDKTITWSDTTDAWTSSEPLDLPAGAQATPSLFFGGDVNSGLYSPGADQVAISTNGQGRLFVDANGNVGVGVSNPGEKIETDGNIQIKYPGNALDPSGARYLYFNNTDTTLVANQPLGGLSWINNDDDATSGETVFVKAYAGANTGASYLVFGTGLQNAATERLRLTSTGEFEFTGAGTAGTSQAVYFSGSAPVDSLVIDSSGRLLVGTSTALDKFGSDKTPRLQVEGTTREDSSISITRWNVGNTTPPVLFFGGTNSNTSGVYTLVDDDEEIGEISFEGTDGSKFIPGAKITAAVDGTPDADDMPSRLVFSTRAATESSPTARMTIKADGKVGINKTSPLKLLDVGSVVGDGISIGGTPAGTITRETEGLRITGSSTNKNISFVTAGSEACRIDTSGRVGINQTDPDYTLDVTGSIRATVQGRFGNGTAEAPSYSFNSDSDTGMLRVSTNTLGFATGGTNRVIISDSGTLRPATDDSQLLGTSTKRWSQLYAGTATINTSDATLKQDIENLNAAELTVATAIKGLIKKYRFTDAVNAKGDDARIHVGVIAQEVEQAFLDAGLDASRYALFCRDTWYELDGSPFDSENNEVTADTPGAVEETRLGIRYSELLAFVIAAM